MSLRMPRERFTRQPWHCQSNTPHLNSRLREDWIKWMERHAKRSTSEFVASQLYSATCMRQRSPSPRLSASWAASTKVRCRCSPGWFQLRSVKNLHFNQPFTTINWHATAHRNYSSKLPFVEFGMQEKVMPLLHLLHCQKKKLLLYWNWNNCNWKKVADWHRRLLAERLLYKYHKKSLIQKKQVHFGEGRNSKNMAKFHFYTWFYDGKKLWYFKFHNKSMKYCTLVCQPQQKI